MNIEQAAKQFFGSNKFATYSDQTQRQYTYLIANSMDIEIDGTPLRSLEVGAFTRAVASELYRKTSERGVTVANQTRTAFTALFVTVMGFNPFKGADLLTAGKKTVTDDDVRKFLNVAYSQFKWRNVGLLVQMTYEQGQYINDLAKLEWTDIDFNDSVMIVKDIATAISPDLYAMLKQQHKDFGFQRYVAPNPNGILSNGYQPYGVTQLSRTLKKIREVAGLDDTFIMADVRRLGFMSMLRDGYTNEELQIIAHDENNKLEFRRTIDRLRKDM